MFRGTLIWAGMLALAGCAGQESKTARAELAGEVLISKSVFEDANTFKTAVDYKKAFGVTKTLEMSAPQTTLRWYAAFQEPLGTDKYIVLIHDTTEGSDMPVVAEIVDTKPVRLQVTGSWTFDIPEWPPPTENVVEDIWAKPGHRYKMTVLRPVAVGEFTVGGEPTETAVEVESP
jgi:hypothetical protein